MSDVADVALVGEDLVVTPRRGLLPELKTIGARWDPRGRVWRLAACRMNAVALAEMVGDHGVEVRPPEPVRVADERLFDWQREIVGRLAAAPRGQVVVAEPGLGKTVMAIVAADLAVPDDQVVVVVPPPLLGNWEREIVKWAADPSVAVAHGVKVDWDEVRAARWVLTTWHVLSLHQDWFLDRWPLWIMDESILAKSRASTFSKSVRGGRRKGKTDPVTGEKTPDKSWQNLRRGVDRVWLLSGSPTSRYDDDAWAQLAVVWPRAFPSYWRFADRYCVIEENRWSPGPGTVVANRRDRSVAEDNSDLMIVVDQRSVIDLPEYVPDPVDVDLGVRQRVAYDEVMSSFVTTLSSGREVAAENKMAQLTLLQQIVSYWDGESSKHDAVLARILDGRWEPPFLLWTHWVEGAEALQERLLSEGVRSLHVRGGQQRQQDASIEAYKRGDVDALVLSLGVGKFGHTLVNSKTVAYVDTTWNADDYYQSIRRVRRIGLTHSPRLVPVRAPGTTDDLVETNLEVKVEGISRMNNADLRELLLGLGR